MASATDCLDETTAARLLDRSLSGVETEQIARHIDSCDDCRAFVAALARTQAADATARETLDVTSFAAGFAPAIAQHALDVSPEDPPRQVGRYQLTRCLGSGAMGSVYAAHDPELGRELAIKLLRLGAGVSRQARSRLMREAKALAKGSHPSVVAVYDVGTIDDQVFIAMELVRTGTLRAYLAQPLSIDAIVRVMTDVGRGLAAAHAAGLVHRDVKPDNILVD